MQHDPDIPLPCTADEIEDALRQLQAGSPDALNALKTRRKGAAPSIASLLHEPPSTWAGLALVTRQAR